MRIDYRSFLDKMWEAMPADEYVAMASDPHVLGDPLLKTQHFIGASRWEKVSDTEVVGWHQLRVPHQRYTDETRTEVAIKGHAHGTNQHWYRKVDGQWKFAGLAPEIRWGEFDFEKVFASGRDTFGEQEKALQETTDISVLTGRDTSGDQEKALEETTDVSAASVDLPGTTVQAEPTAKVPIDEEAVHTASGIGSTIENMPVEVMAKMMQGTPDKYNSLSSEGVVGA